MATQTERQGGISQLARIGARKNRRSLHQVRISRTAEGQGVALDGTTNPPMQQDAVSARTGNLHRQGAPAVYPECPVPPQEFTGAQMQWIYRTAYRITRNREDAQDATQDACLQALAHFQDFDGRSKFSTWLTRIAINSSLMILRKRKRTRTVSLDSAADPWESNAFPEVTDPAPHLEDRHLQKEREAALHTAIHRLRPSLKSVIELAQLRECSLRETAEALGLSVGAVKTRLFRARRTLHNSRRLRSLSR